MNFYENKKVLVPIDFSPIMKYAIDHAAGVSKQINAEISLLHVINKESKDLLKKDKIDKKLICKELEIIADDANTKYSVNVNQIAKEGSIFSTIADITEKVNAGIVIMGTHGKVGLQHLVGSYALKVIENSPVPVIVVQEKEFGHGYRNIVLPVDETPETKQKVVWAIHLAKIFKSTIHLLGMHHTDEHLMGYVKNNLAQIKNILGKNNISYTEKISKSKETNFAKSIIMYAATTQADIIMIMTNPNQLLPSFIISSWSEQVLFNSLKIPVLCVNPVDLDIQHIRF